MANRTVRQGARGKDVRLLQTLLNARSSGPRKLKPDAIFGRATGEAVRQFQAARGLKVDGVVGPKTWATLLVPAPAVAARACPNLTTFVGKIGTAGDFVEHVHGLETIWKRDDEVFEVLSDFYGTKNGRRYLLVGNPHYGVLDFRHFFAAAGEASHSARSVARTSASLGGSRGRAVLLGVLNELAQCVDEASRAKLQSCFACDDLISNRLGAEFGRAVTIERAEAHRDPLSAMLRDYLAALKPLAPDETDRIHKSGAVGVLAEVVAAVLLGLLDFAIPEAY